MTDGSRSRKRDARGVTASPEARVTAHARRRRVCYARPIVPADIARQVATGSAAIAGVLLESHLVEGRQDVTDGRAGLRYGQSVTDGCIGWESTVAVLEGLAAAVRARRAANG